MSEGTEASVAASGSSPVQIADEAQAKIEELLASAGRSVAERIAMERKVSELESSLASARRAADSYQVAADDARAAIEATQQKYERIAGLYLDSLLLQRQYEKGARDASMAFHKILSSVEAIVKVDGHVSASGAEVVEKALLLPHTQAIISELQAVMLRGRSR